jgi:hypothetical protein
MKTKALIAAGLVLTLAPALQAAVTLTIPDGEYRLIAGCRFQGFTTPTNFIAPTNAQPSLFQFNKVTGYYDINVWALGAWDREPIFSFGEGAIWQSYGDDATLSFEQKTATKLPLQLTTGFNLVCCQSNIVAGFEDIVGIPPANGTLLYQFNAGPGRNPFNLAAPDYSIFTFANGAWSPTNPIIGITEAVFVYQPPQLSNAQATANGISFEILPPINQQFVIEYTDSLTQPSWQTLTNIVGSGASIKITDNSIGTSVQQRFYRARSSN